MDAIVDLVSNQTEKFDNDAFLHGISTNDY
jgi:hypothetical protein